MLVGDDRVETVAQAQLRPLTAHVLTVSGYEQIGVEDAAVNADLFSDDSTTFSFVRKEGPPRNAVVRIGKADLVIWNAQVEHPLRDELLHRIGVPAGEIHGMFDNRHPAIRGWGAGHAGFPAKESRDAFEQVA